MAETKPRLEAFKTLHETRQTDEYVEAFVAEIPAKLASKALGIVKPIFPHDRNFSLNHLRRVVTLAHLPIDLTWRRDYDSNGLQTVFLLLPNTTVPWQTICETLAQHIDVKGLPRCFNAIVPRYAPLSAEQAKLWTERYWPTIYNPAAQVVQDAPPINQLRKLLTELDTPDTNRFLEVARQAAAQTHTAGHGRSTGAVVVDPSTQEILAVAGDARWWSINTNTCQRAPVGAGRAEYHPLMRVIAMVANKELKRRLKAGSHSRFASTCTETPSGQALTEIEKQYAEIVPMSSNTTSNPLSTFTTDVSESLPTIQSTTMRGDGYLCSGLDVYLTHEPCVCCSMAMIHSRFRACVVEKKMPGSGGLTARDHPGGLAYGLFWRRELNWRVMTFQYKHDENDRGRSSGQKIKFHA